MRVAIGDSSCLLCAVMGAQEAETDDGEANKRLDMSCRCQNPSKMNNREQSRAQ